MDQPLSQATLSAEPAEAEARRRGGAPERLRRRADFVAVAKGRRVHAKGFVLQIAPGSKDAPPRFGFTVTKKLGGAVKRNRIRRRLKEALRTLDPLPARAGHDYVIVARPEALDMAFPALQAELARAIAEGPRKRKPIARKDHAQTGI